VASPSIVQSIVGTNPPLFAGEDGIILDLPNPPTAGNTLLAIITCNYPVGFVGPVDLNWTSVKDSLTGQNIGSNVSPYLYVYETTVGSASPDAWQEIEVTSSNNNGPWYFAVYFAEIANGISKLGLTITTNTTSPTISTTDPRNWLADTGDLPFTIWITETATTATDYPGWTNIATITPPSPGNVYTLNIQQGPAATSGGQNYTGGVTWGVTNPIGIGVALSVNSSFYDFTSQEFLEAISVGATSGTSGVPKSSQEFLEAISQDTANARSSQTIIEAIGQDTANARGSQEIVEVVGQDTANSRASQMFIELVVPLYVRTTQAFAELVCSTAPNVRTSQMWLDVLFSSQGQRRRVIDDELITY